jgi:DNA-binding transcriptional LysR family regulator
MPLARSFIVPSAVIAFQQEQPHHDVSIMEGTYEHLVAALHAGEADFLIGALRDERASVDVRQEHLFDDPLSIAVRAGHPLASRKRLSAGDLARYPWIAPRTSSPLHAYFDKLFATAGVAVPAHPVQCNSLIAARAFLLESDCMMLSSVHQIHYELQAGLLAALPHPQGEVVRPIGLTVRRNWQPTRAQARLLEIVRERAKSAPRSPWKKMARRQ